MRPSRRAVGKDTTDLDAAAFQRKKTDELNAVIC